MAAAKVLAVFVTLMVIFCEVSFSTKDGSCYKELKEPLPNHIVTKPPHQKLNPSVIPDSFDWRDVNNTYFVSPVTNQFLPSPCGCCWAHAAVGALTDRMMIATQAKRSIVPLSPQVLLDCADPDLGSCHGGSALGAYKFIFKNGITDITCSPFMGVDSFYWAEVPCNETMCRTCDRFGKCSFIKGPTYFISEYGTVTGEDQMKAEVFARGPIACSVYAHSAAFEEYTGGVIHDPVQYNSTTHVVAVTGWGTDEKTGMKYWIGRNSFGTAWGEDGWFKLQRGVNALDIEKHTCAWAVPKM
uniref:cathepsin X n=1 Tax=Suberites domuncula TaxID=55567 RepID=Q6A1H9_SUBDO|nr:cathepsin X/O [Suberites domuncula]